MNGEMPIGMAGSFNLCDVRDLAHGCVAAADKGRKGQCYILGNKEVTLKEVCRMLKENSQCSTPLFYLPIKLAMKIAGSMEKKAQKTGKMPIMTTFDYSKAEQELGYTTRPYEETLQDEVNWLIKEGLIKERTVSRRVAAE